MHLGCKRTVNRILTLPLFWEGFGFPFRDGGVEDVLWFESECFEGEVLAWSS